MIQKSWNGRLRGIPARTSQKLTKSPSFPKLAPKCYHHNMNIYANFRFCKFTPSQSVGLRKLAKFYEAHWNFSQFYFAFFSNMLPKYSNKSLNNLHCFQNNVYMTILQYGESIFDNYNAHNAQEMAKSLKMLFNAWKLENVTMVISS